MKFLFACGSFQRTFQIQRIYNKLRWTNWTQTKGDLLENRFVILDSREIISIDENEQMKQWPHDWCWSFWSRFALLFVAILLSRCIKKKHTFRQFWNLFNAKDWILNLIFFFAAFDVFSLSVITIGQWPAKQPPYSICFSSFLFTLTVIAWVKLPFADIIFVNSLHESKKKNIACYVPKLSLRRSVYFSCMHYIPGNAHKKADELQAGIRNMKLQVKLSSAWDFGRMLSDCAKQVIVQCLNS